MDSTGKQEISVTAQDTLAPTDPGGANNSSKIARGRNQCSGHRGRVYLRCGDNGNAVVEIREGDPALVIGLSELETE